ncbi:SusC/RagA family TonB-linked outer membrane protein [Sphingobacterium sp. UT-1RO-CII-1]|uniref:SusC/RagA family TonB-linked outer membrane protein n=1 Tax=Sphingobacterium sp. UT-1RO-CII-1 TaxID=2995225 RepID=UPI00227A874F|nr:SusC/RagA family TonB-linked outer membrane protein [Sphingobacterium sp. UT-1RO-CII-1]MCY4780032.1 SusC/RagA family TonB-linked outer membrane protein [Sphingobacterium sp. UT-1RO-CII-1]
MNIIVAVLLFCSLSLSAEVYSQNINLHLKNASMSDVFKEIERQSGYDIFYNVDLIESLSKKNVSVNKVNVNDALNVILKETDLEYKIEDRIIVVFPKKKPEANQAIVHGKIVNEEGESLAGATILEKGTTNGTTTGQDGVFQLKTTKQGAILVVQVLGYITQEVAISNAFMDITLIREISQLDEVVVQAYGTTTKRKTTSAIATLDMTNVATIPVQSVNDGIAGRLPGVIVTASSGAPGSKSSISIRGGLTPLYVIDDVIRSSNDFSNLNPNDIEDLSILKDAAATALYGVSAANGVVVVRTKKGKEGRMSLSYAYNQIFSQPTLFPKRVSSYDRFSMINRLYKDETGAAYISDEDLEKYRTGSDPYNFPNTDWQKLTMKDFASEMRHDLSVTSGTKLLKYYGGLSYYDQGSILKTDNNYNKRMTYRLNTTSTFEKLNLTATTGFDGFIENNAVPAQGNVGFDDPNGAYYTIYSHIQNVPTNALAMNEFGLPSTHPDNPFRELDPKSGYNKAKAKVLNVNLGLEYAAHFLEGLKFKFNGTYNSYNNTRKMWSYLAPGYMLGSTTPVNANAPSLTVGQGEGAMLTLQGYVMYNKRFGDHEIDFTGVYEQQEGDASNIRGSRVNYQIIYDQMVAGPATDQSVSAGEGEEARAAYLGRLSYGYKSRYSVEVSLRRDGDYLFPPKSQWGNFYAFSGNYILSDEPFMQSLKERHIIDFLKLRGSFGVLGDKKDFASGENIDAFQYVPAYSINPTAWVINGNMVQGTSEPESLPNATYSWQEIKSRNIALEFGTLNSKLNGSFDYYYTERSGFVVGDPRFAQTLGIGLPRINFEDAEYRTEGYDINVNWSDKIRDFTYRIGLNYTYSNSLWARTPDETEADLKNPYTRKSGIPGSFYGNGYQNLGFYTNNSDLLTGAHVAGGGFAAGDLRYFDANGDGQINSADNRRIGSSTFPRSNYGLTVDLGYKGFSFSTVIQGAGSRDRYLGGVLQGDIDVVSRFPYDFQADYWRPDNTAPLYPRAVTNASVNSRNNLAESDFYLLQSKYLRLKYLQLGYDFKHTLLKNAPFQQLRMFLSGTNLLTFSNSKKFFIDPESDVSNYQYPIQRTFAIGVNATF